MFGRKKKKKKKKTSEDIISYKVKERRKSFRVRPSNKEPVSVDVDGNIIQVFDISAGGVAFDNCNLEAGKNQSINIHLPGRIIIESITIKILSIDSKEICHAQFIKIESTQREKIHKYTLKRQVEIARENKEVKARNWHTRM